MGTALVRFITSESDAMHWGVLREQAVYPLALAANHHRDIMATYFERRETFESALSPIAIEVNDLTFQAPLSQDIQLLCQGLNYASHREEVGLASKPKAAENLIFQKASSTICPPNADIVRPVDCQLLDYELELGLVLRADVPPGCVITDDNLPDYLGGLVLCNDVSARDLQFGASMMQWYRGKSQPGFCPTGPILYLMEPQDFQSLYDLQLTLSLNGEEKQQANTSQLIHRPPETLSDLASFMGLRSGDCLLSGTPGGVQLDMDRKTGMAIMLNLKNNAKRRAKFTKAQLARQRYLQAGDTLELSIRSGDGLIDLGRQNNTVVLAGEDSGA